MGTGRDGATVAARVALGLGLAGFGTVVAPWTVRTTLCEPFRIPSASMQPTLLIGDHVLVAKARYGLGLPLLGQVVSWSVPRRGDVIVFRYPRDPSLSYVKRVVGLPGETVSFRHNHVVIDGVELVSEPVADIDGVDDHCQGFTDHAFTERDGERAWTVTVRAGVPGPLADQEPFEVPPGHVFVAGDARDASEDSRRWGTLPLSEVLGQVQDRWFSWDDCAGAARLERFGTAVGP